MTQAIDLAPYALVLVLDTQLVLQGKPLETLPWRELGDGPILLLCTPTMLSEVDKFKRDGRLGQRARHFNRLTEGCLSDGGIATLMDEAVRVDIAFVASGRIDWVPLDDLDPAVGDDKIVAEMLHAKVSDPAHLILFSYDMRPLAAARRHGLGWKKPADHWLLEPEPSPHQKEVQRLQQRVRELETSQPAIEVELAAPPDTPFRPVRVQPLDESISRILAELYLEKHSPQGRGRFDFLTDHSYDDRYEAFERRVRSHGANIAGVLELFFNQYALQLSIKAPGAMAAEHLEIAFDGDGLLVHDRMVLGPLFLPQPPEYEPDSFIRRIADTALELPVRYGRSDVHFDPELERKSSARLVCEDFRNRRHFERRLYVTFDPRRASPAVLRYRVTAANLRGATEREIALPFEAEDVKVSVVRTFGTTRGVN